MTLECYSVTNLHNLRRRLKDLAGDLLLLACGHADCDCELCAIEGSENMLRGVDSLAWMMRTTAELISLTVPDPEETAALVETLLTMRPRGRPRSRLRTCGRRS